MPTSALESQHTVSTPSTSDAIHVQRLGTRLGGRVIIEQISMRVPGGRICGLLGPNGAGKSTLLRCLSGQLRPDYGRSTICGFDTWHQAQAARPLFAYQADLPALEDDLRIDEYLRLHAHLRGIPRRHIDERLTAVLDDSALSAQRRQRIGQLSRGQRSRVALAESLLHQPRVLILDEPSAGLDPAQVVELRHLLLRLAGRCTILLASHALSEVQTLCQQVVVLANGRVRFDGSLAELRGDGDLETAYLGLTGAAP